MPNRSVSSARLSIGGGILLAAAVLGSCNVVALTAEAKETWTRRYTLAHGGSVDIRNTNGETEILAGDGNSVEVTATKVARAMSDQAAKDALKDVVINETIAPDRVALDSRTNGVNFDFDVSRRVDYVVHLPRWANVTLRATNGELRIRDLDGTLEATTTNGEVDGQSLGGRTTVKATNGRVTLDFAQVGDGDISCGTTNGMISMTLPSAAKATLTATVTNGAISTDGVDLAVTEQSRRRLEGTINGGGTTIRLSTTNGAISIRSR